MPVQNPGDQFAKIARELHEQPSPATTLDRVVELAVESIKGCDHAGISLIERRRITTAAATDDVVTAGDAQQYEMDEGPCMDSIRDQESVTSADLSVEQRWPNWAPWANTHLGVGSMLCFQLYTSENKYGALNMYSDSPHGFDARDHAVGLALAAHAAVALAASSHAAHLGAALLNRTVIGQAEGILMERYGLSADRAFGFLVRVSQQENRRLALVAEDLVNTRSTPGDDEPQKGVLAGSEA
ncbi:GAF and ANTAR domain-containing protein [Propionibacteriaceae bacterium Y2011]